MASARRRSPQAPASTPTPPSTPAAAATRGPAATRDAAGTRAPAEQQPAAGAPASRAPAHAVLRLQHRAGNRSVARLVRGSTAQVTVQRFGVEDLKDAYKHFQDWRHGDRRTPEAEEDWSEHSEEVALHAKQVIELSKAAYDHAAAEAMRAGNSEALEAAHQASEKAEQAGKLLESGERVFKWGVKTVKVIDQLNEMYEAARILQEADLGNPDEQQKAAAALDTLAGGFGKLGGEAVGGGPFKGYFDFLGQFSGAHFFAHWAGFVHSYTDRIMSYSKED